MNVKAGALASLVVVGLVVVTAASLGGCAKGKAVGTGQPQAAATQTSAAQQGTETVAAEQKTCPVMEGNPINKNIFLEYKGKKVYFCCSQCKAKFLADPEDYVAKLPQFAK